MLIYLKCTDFQSIDQNIVFHFSIKIFIYIALIRIIWSVTWMDFLLQARDWCGLARRSGVSCFNVQGGVEGSGLWMVHWLNILQSKPKTPMF